MLFKRLLPVLFIGFFTILSPVPAHAQLANLCSSATDNSVCGSTNNTQVGSYCQSSGVWGTCQPSASPRLYSCACIVSLGLPSPTPTPTPTITPAPIVTCLKVSDGSFCNQPGYSVGQACQINSKWGQCQPVPNVINTCWCDPKYGPPSPTPTPAPKAYICCCDPNNPTQACQNLPFYGKTGENYCDSSPNPGWKNAPVAACIPTPAPIPVSQFTTTFDYASDIKQFMDAGADAYLAWQYSGDKGGTIENDQYSFFRNSDTCNVLQAASKTYSGKIGVNIWRYHHHLNEIDLNYLKNNCGTSIVRFFGTDSPDLVVSAVQRLQGSGIKAVVALQNFALGGDPNSFFNPSNYAASKQYSIDVAIRIKNAGLTDNIYTLELSNEPHCGNDAVCVPKYLAWAKDVSSAIRAIGYSGDISLGQASQVSRDSRGDSVSMGSPLDFQASNDVSTITKTSGHHYGTEYISENLKALSISQNTLHKPFYIGEAAGSDKNKAVYKAIPTKDGYVGGINGCTNITKDDSLLSKIFWFVWWGKSTTENKCYFPNTAWNYGTPITDPCGAAKKPTDIKLEDRVKWINPDQKLTALVKSVWENPPPNPGDDSEILKYGLGRKDEPQTDPEKASLARVTYDSAAPQADFSHNINGSGKGITSETSAKTPDQLTRIYNNFQTGSLSRMTSYENNNDDTTREWLCQLAMSNVDKACFEDQAYQVLDFPLGFKGNLTDRNYNVALFDAASVATDRTKTNTGDTDQIIKASDIYCALKPSCNVSSLGVAVKYANINADCSHAVKLSPPAHLSDCGDPQKNGTLTPNLAMANNIDLLSPDQIFFCTLYAKLRVAILDNKINAPDIAFSEVCTENPAHETMGTCSKDASTQGVLFVQNYDFLDNKEALAKHLPGAQDPDVILNQYGGRYVKLTDRCYSCQVTKILLPGLSQALAANSGTGCGLAAAQSTHSVGESGVQIVIDMGLSAPVTLDKTFTPNSLGISNYGAKPPIKFEGLSWKFDLKTTLANIFGNIQIPGTCNADYYDESVVTGYTTTGQAIMSVLNLAHKTCDNVDTIKVQNILWTTKKAQIAYNCSKNLNNNLMSQSSIDQIDKNPTTYLGTEAQYSTNNCGMGSGAREMSMGSHQAYTGGCGDNASNAKTLIEAVSKSDITRTIGRGCNFYSSDEIKKLGLDCPTNSSL